MLVNADCTVIEISNGANITVQGVHPIKGVYWNDSRGQTVTKNGVQVSDSILVYLYRTAYVPKAGDILLKGLADIPAAADTEQSASLFMAELRNSHPDFAVIKSVNDCRYGGLPHIEIIAG